MVFARAGSGEILSFVVDSRLGGEGELQLDILSADGNRLETGLTAPNAKGVINNFASDGSPIRLLVSGDEQDYTLFVIRNGQFEIAGNHSNLLSHPISVTGNTIGHFQNNEDWHGYVGPNQEQTIEVVDSTGAVGGFRLAPASIRGNADLFAISVNRIDSIDGQYFLHAPESVPNELQFVTIPPNGARTADPGSFVVDSIYPLRESSLQPADLQINGIAAESVMLINGQLAKFTFPRLSEGDHTATLAMGSLLDVTGRTNPALETTYTVDITRPFVVETSIANGDTVPSGPLEIAIRFSEDVTVNSPGILRLVGQQSGALVPTSIEYDSTEHTLTIGFDTSIEETYSIHIAGDRIRDLAGHALDGDISIQFSTDISEREIQGPFTKISPFGSLAYQSDPFSGVISDGDIDDFVIELEADQYLTASVSARNGLIPELVILDPSGQELGRSSGKATSVSTITSDTGRYSISISGQNGTTGSFSVDVQLNTLIETNEPNNKIESAQSLAGLSTKFDLGDVRQITVKGQLDEIGLTTIVDDSFETGALSDQWSIDTSDGNARVQVSDELGAGDGNFALLMDSGPIGAFARRPAVLVIYDPSTGELSLDSPAPMTTFEIISESGIFTGEPAQNLASQFKVDTDTKIFKLGPEGFGNLSFGNVAQTGLSYEFLRDDLEIAGSWIGGGVPDYDLIVVEEGIRAEAIWTVDLTGMKNPQLQFLHSSWNDSPTHLPISFADTVQGDGVSMSSDGETWYRLFTPVPQQNGEWISEAVGLTEISRFAEISLDGPVQFKFQHYGNGMLPDQGRGFDQIRINGEATDQDWYSLELSDGESVSLFVESPARDELLLGLFDSNGQLLTESSGSQISAIQNFVDSTSDHASDIYSLRVRNATGNAAEYTLLTTYDAGFHIEQNEGSSGSGSIQAGFKLIYDSVTGQIDIVVDVPLATIELTTQDITFFGTKQDFPGSGENSYYGGIFDVYNDHKAFKLEPSGFGNVEPLINFANVGPGLSIDHLMNDLKIAGAPVGGGRIQDIPGGVHFVGTGQQTNDGRIFDLTVAKSYVGFLNVGDRDFYQIELAADSLLTIETSTPGDGPLLSNELDPQIRLFGPDGELVASDDNSAADGRNVLLEVVAIEAGVYGLEISGEDSDGEYTVSIGGDFPIPGFKSLRTSPEDGEMSNQELSEFQVQLNRLVDRSSVQAADLSINGQLASAVGLLAPDTVSFEIQGEIPQGDVVFTIPAGAFRDLRGRESEEVVVNFTYDTIAPFIEAISLDEDETITAGPLTIDIQFSEAVDASRVSEDEIRLVTFNKLIAPIATNYDAETFTMSLDFGDIEEGNYEFRFTPSTIFDLAGNRFSSLLRRSFTALETIEPYTGGFTSALPLESFAFASETIEKTFAFADDVDIITFDLAANQLINVWTGDLQGQHQATLVDPSGREISSQTGNRTNLVAVGKESGTYSIVLETVAGSARAYQSHILLNQIVETETLGLQNNVPSRAQVLNRFFRGEFVDRVTISGSAQRGQDWYSLDVDPGERISLGLSSENQSISLQLLDEELNKIEEGIPGANFDLSINEYLDRSLNGLPSNYWILVESNTGTAADYTLTVSRDSRLEFETGPTELGPSLTAMGNIESGAAMDEYRFHADFVGNIAVQLHVPFTDDGIPNSSLVASLRLVDPNGQEVATGSETLNHVAVAAGVYTAQVVADSGMGGYGIRVSGDSVGPNRIEILSATPEPGLTFFGLPGHVTLEFSHVVSPATVETTDVLISGTPASAIQQLAPNKFSFIIGADADVGDGEYIVQLAADAISDSSGIGNEAFETNFSVDRSSADFDDDGVVEVDDLNVLCTSIRHNGLSYDINQDGVASQEDYIQLLRDIFGTMPGDITVDGRFNSSDLVRMFEVGKYEGEARDAVWSDGDFNCDGRVSSFDLVLAFRDGNYEQPVAAVAVTNDAIDSNEPKLDSDIGMAVDKEAPEKIEQQLENVPVVAQQRARALQFQVTKRLFERDIDRAFENVEQDVLNLEW